jgi:hypothetical protein
LFTAQRVRRRPEGGGAADPWAQFRSTPKPAKPDEYRTWNETDPRWITAAWTVYGTTYGAALLCGLGRGDIAQWRWILSPLFVVTGLLNLVRPQAAFEVENPRYWFRDGVREPSLANLRWTRAGGVLLIAVAILPFVVSPP